MHEHALLSDLPKMFDRNFAVGFVLPAILLISGSYLVLFVFGLRPPWMAFWNEDGTIWTGTWVVDQKHAEIGSQIAAYVALHTAKS